MMSFDIFKVRDIQLNKGLGFRVLDIQCKLLKSDKSWKTSKHGYESSTRVDL